MKYLTNIEMMESLSGWMCERIIYTTFNYNNPENEFQNFLMEDFDNDIRNSLKNFFANKDLCKNPSYITLEIPFKLIKTDASLFDEFCCKLESSFGVSCVLVTNESDITSIDALNLTESFYHLPLIVCYDCDYNTLLNVVLKFGGYANILSLHNK
jgi:hypothetical protein